METKKFRASVKVVSDIKFDEFVERQRGTTNLVFVEMLKESSYFRDLFFEAFLEGMEYGAWGEQVISPPGVQSDNNATKG